MALPAAALAVQAYKNRPKVQMGTTAGTILLATGIGVGIFFGVRALVRKAKRNARERNALDPGNPANYATRLKMAFENDNAFGWGTDEEAVFRTLEEIPSNAMRKRVERAYKDLYGRNLAADLKSELSTAEYAVAQQIITTKP